MLSQDVLDCDRQGIFSRLPPKTQPLLLCLNLPPQDRRICQGNSQPLLFWQTEIHGAYGVKELRVQGRIPSDVRRFRCVAPNVTKNPIWHQLAVNQITVENRLKERVTKSPKEVVQRWADACAF